MSSSIALKDNLGTLPETFGGEYLFEKIDPSANCRRHYRITCSGTLWKEFAIERSWGRIGIKNPASRFLFFEKEDEALKWLKRFILRRLRRGYRLVSNEFFEVLPERLEVAG